MNKKWIKIGAAAVVLCAVIVAIIAVANRGNSHEAQVTQGMEMIRSMETVSVAAVEEKIRQIEIDEKKNNEEYRNRPINVKFEGSLVMGDSQAESLVFYKILDESEVIAHKGKRIQDASGELETVVNLNPKNIFLTYGMNDLGLYASGEEFAAVYKSFIQQLSEALPDTNIYVCSIFPALPKAVARQSYLGNAPAFSDALKAACEEIGITYIDSNSLVNESSYDQDGVHMNYEFYKTWAEYLAETTGL